ncbi:hypothetical protein FRC18_007245 [Serendipita sp. 400]|nr:hypothetical protein FRC18_007245 [Serendipita sp. 400]
MCKLYVEELGKVPKSALDAAGTRIVVIGCGEWSVIKKYREDSNNYPYDIYAEPTRALHQKLGLLSNRYGAGPGEKRKSYAGKVLTVGLASLATWIRKGYDITKVGNLSQVGGDFVLGPGSKVTFAARMKNTQDHVEIDDLMKAAGVAYSTGVSQLGLTG